MEEKVQTEEGISLLDIVKLLFQKILLLIFIAVISGLLGGIVGFAKSYNVNYWGTTVEFYVNPYKNEETEDPLNPGASATPNIGSQYGVYGAYGRHVMDNMIKLLSSESFAEFLIDGVKMQTNQGEVVISKPMKNIPKKIDFDKNGKEYITLEYKEFLQKVDESVKFRYLEDEKNGEDVNNLARSFIYVDISVINDKEFAETLLESVESVVPWYISKNMTVPADYDGTNCKKITVLEGIELTNPGYATTETLKFIVLFAFASVVIASVVIIIVDKSDKRLRDYEAVMRSLDVPVLGVIPTIEPILQKAKIAENKTMPKTEVKR